MQVYALPDLPPPASVAELDRRKAIHQQLVLLLHANKCRKQEIQAELAGEEWQCTVNRCRTMKRILTHLTSCRYGQDCMIPHCPLSRQVIIHWKDCTLENCAYCLPVKQLDINRTYKLYETGKACEADWKHAFDTLHIPNSDMGDNILLKECTVKNYLPAERRARVVQRIALSLLPTTDPTVYMDKRWHRLTAYATKLEGDMFEMANTSNEYYHFLAVKIFDVQKQLDEKRKQRKQQERGAGVPTPPDSRPVTPPLR